jgi:hypothetical protein
MSNSSRLTNVQLMSNSADVAPRHVSHHLKKKKKNKNKNFKTSVKTISVYLYPFHHFPPKSLPPSTPSTATHDHHHRRTPTSPPSVRTYSSTSAPSPSPSPDPAPSPSRPVRWVQLHLHLRISVKLHRLFSISRQHSHRWKNQTIRLVVVVIFCLLDWKTQEKEKKNFLQNSSFLSPFY